MQFSPFGVRALLLAFWAFSPSPSVARSRAAVMICAVAETSSSSLWPALFPVFITLLVHANYSAIWCPREFLIPPPPSLAEAPPAPAPPSPAAASALSAGQSPCCCFCCCFSLFTGANSAHVLLGVSWQVHVVRFHSLYYCFGAFVLSRLDNPLKCQTNKTISKIELPGLGCSGKFDFCSAPIIHLLFSVLITDFSLLELEQFFPFMFEDNIVSVNWLASSLATIEPFVYFTSFLHSETCLFVRVLRKCLAVFLMCSQQPVLFQVQ